MSDADFKLPPIRVLNRDHYTEADLKAEQRRNTAWREHHKACRQVLKDHGWRVFARRAYVNNLCTHGMWAEDPTDRTLVLEKEAFRLQEERTPGCFPAAPVFDDGWVPPLTDKGLVSIGSVEVKPMRVPRGAIFYMSFEDKVPK